MYNGDIFIFQHYFSVLWDLDRWLFGRRENIATTGKNSRLTPEEGLLLYPSSCNNNSWIETIWTENKNVSNDSFSSLIMIPPISIEQRCFHSCKFVSLYLNCCCVVVLLLFMLWYIAYTQ